MTPPLLPASPNAVSDLMARQAPQSLQQRRSRRWTQMPAQPQGVQSYPCRLCSQMEAPPQKRLLMRVCPHMDHPPPLLHQLLQWPCSQMPDPPQLLHWPPRRSHSQMDARRRSSYIGLSCGRARRWRRLRSSCIASLNFSHITSYLLNSRRNRLPHRCSRPSTCGQVRFQRKKLREKLIVINTSSREASCPCALASN